MSEHKVYPVPESVAARAHVTQAEYEAMYRRSVDDPEGFWAEQAERFLDWFEKWDTTLDWNFEGDVHVEWFKGGKLNVAHNCIDRHLTEHADKTALIWEGDEPDQDQHITFRELHEQVSRLGNVLKERGVSKGDRVCLYMPMIPEAVYAMLACARIGAVHSVVFGGFSPEALKDRIQDAEACVVITADEGVRGGRKVGLKANTDKAVVQCPSVHTVLTVRRTGGDIDWDDSRDVWYHEATEAASADCPAEPMDAEDPLFILYTSGSTGKPKGVLHTTGGYLLYAAITTWYTFDLQPDDVYWCTADVGWITGHSYLVYGPLANATTSVVFEGVPSYPDASRFWEVVDKHQVSVFYTAPTAIRALMREGDEPVTKTDRSSLRILGTVGEPINPEAWEWYYHVVGKEQCPIVDTWWQTETGGHLITPLPGATELKPGSATRPFFGIVPALMDTDGKVVEGEGEGALVITRPWPGQMRTIYGNHQRFVETYFSAFKGCYFSGDGARRDADGDYWITGRMDDVLNVSGHRMGTAEIESALVLHDAVAEAAVVGFPHDVKGQGIYAYVILVKDAEPSDALRKELVNLVRSEIGPIASPDAIQWAPGLPKTRSGKIMRRILRKIAANELDSLGDTSTLADPGVVDELISNRVTD
jgi:acetyl-CoA synthetase